MQSLQLLLVNQCLNTSRYQPVGSNYLDQILGYPFALPVGHKDCFIFSCFALSVDGQLAYPDLANGFAIATHNQAASPAERFADWWSLQLGRSLCDGVIIGSNSLVLANNYQFAATIEVPELIKLRQQLGKSAIPWHIIISRDGGLIDFQRELLMQDNQLPVILVCQQRPAKLPAHFHICHDLDQLQLTHDKQALILDQPDLTALVNRLASLGLHNLLNESPYYHHQLQELGLLNEAWLNTSGVYIGGTTASLGGRSPGFSVNRHPHYTMLTVHHFGYNFLYTRYRIDYP